MTLIVEDGSALDTAESFCSVAAADTYHELRGNTAWANFDEEVKEVYLRRATDYMEQTYREDWDGYRMTATQALSWPRWEVLNRGYRYASWASFIGYNVVPVLVQRACAELALRAKDGPLIPEPLGPEKKRAKVGPIEVEYKDSTLTVKEFPAVDAMLAPFLNRSSKYSAPLRRVR